MKKTVFAVITAFMIGIIPPAYSENLAEGVKSAILMEASCGKVLYEKNPDEHLPIASVTKIMTMLLIMERIESGALSFDNCKRKCQQLWRFDNVFGNG